MENSTMVIKARYGDTLRRFNIPVNENGQLDIDTSGLRSKILGLFGFPPDAEVNLTYVDEDGDVVTLVDDDDLLDVMRQNLKFLRIDVHLSNDKFGKSYARSSGSSTPMRSPPVRIQNINTGIAEVLKTVPSELISKLSPSLSSKAASSSQMQNINTSIAEMLKTVPEPLLEVLPKLSHDLTSKVTSSSPVLAELVECFSKLGQSFQDATSQSQNCSDSGTHSEDAVIPGVQAVPTAINTSKDNNDKQKGVQNSNLAPKINPEPGNKNVTRGVCTPATPVPPVDLNLDPLCETIPSGGTSVNCSPTTVNVPADSDVMEIKKENAGHPTGKSASGVTSSSSVIPPMPSYNDCPFTGLPMPMPMPIPITKPHSVPFKRIGGIGGRHDAMVGMFHKGVQCDGCGILPITGPRYKSKVKDDYDLCSICFAEIGDPADYIKMNRPATPRHLRFLRELHDTNYRVSPPPLARAGRTYGMKQPCVSKPARVNKLDSCFILDVNIFDGTLMIPSTPFTKIWRMQNCGGVAWPQGTQLVWIGGDRFSYADSIELEIPANGVPVDGELDMAVDFTAPELPGRHISYWRMASPSGAQFGQRVWVLIQVDDSLKDSFFEGVQGLNLNLPPVSGGPVHPEITDSDTLLSQGVDLNSQSDMDGGSLEHCKFTSVSQPVNQPVVDEQPKIDQDLNFPINDALLVAHGISATAPASQGPSVSYPVIDFPEAASSASYSALLPTIDGAAQAKDSRVNDVEKSLLKELEEMGFKQVDLNKDILRKNEYNLEQSVDDLCGVGAEWDPFLEELQEMGFCDNDKNKKLLKKNNGSLSRAVMDLVTGEES